MMIDGFIHLLVFSLRGARFVTNISIYNYAHVDLCGKNKSLNHGIYLNVFNIWI